MVPIVLGNHSGLSIPMGFAGPHLREGLLPTPVGKLRLESRHSPHPGLLPPSVWNLPGLLPSLSLHCCG